MKKTTRIVKDVLKNTKIKGTTMPKTIKLPKVSVLPKKVVKPTSIFKILMDLINKLSLWLGTLSLIIKLRNILPVIFAKAKYYIILIVYFYFFAGKYWRYFYFIYSSVGALFLTLWYLGIDFNPDMLLYTLKSLYLQSIGYIVGIFDNIFNYFINI